ncbi:hypothetical protein MNVI_16990 [Mycobacterium noviomagense]|uniref:Uncharacterized protein n=1 Tax=Mycobacterium noviomagense TaxID=459858 RepID=A0A7I7PCP0_9MYCO|nr:hypothetical protein BST37_12200 [Mycobacterium noviomagense]BBY06381.1 hypothetical protein MNVI_16990 [Mycobacterium noviomagense]
MSDKQGVLIDANALASRTVTKPAAFSWPFPADRRLDQLVEIANGAGANARRNELAAAIIAAAPTDPDELLQMVIAWRKSRVREVVLGVDAAAQVVDMPRHPPGRRRVDAG